MTITTGVCPAEHVDFPAAGAGTALVWEIRKLAAQAKARYTLLGALIAPALIVVVLHTQQRPPKDTLFGRHITESGYAVPLLVLGFASPWVFPLLTSIVAGDIFASEDQHGTWKTILTRSASRSSIFVAKTVAAMAFALAVLTLVAVSTISASLIVVGRQSLTGLGGQQIGSGHAFWLVVASWALCAAPLIGFTALALLLSVVSRNPAIGIASPVVIGLVMQLIGALGGFDTVRMLLLTTPFEAWHGLLAAPRFLDLAAIGVAVSAGWTIACLGAAYAVLIRRDFTGG